MKIEVAMQMSKQGSRHVMNLLKGNHRRKTKTAVFDLGVLGNT